MLLNKLKGFIFLFFYIRRKPLPDIKISAKLKGFAADKLIASQNIRFIFHLLENIVGKGENAGYQHFLYSPPPPNVFFSSQHKIQFSNRIYYIDWKVFQFRQVWNFVVW